MILCGPRSNSECCGSPEPLLDLCLCNQSPEPILPITRAILNSVSVSPVSLPTPAGPKNMVTAIKAPNTSFPNSAAFYVSSGDTQGFIDDQACVTQDGYGYNGRGSQVGLRPIMA